MRSDTTKICFFKENEVQVEKLWINKYCSVSTSKQKIYESRLAAFCNEKQDIIPLFMSFVSI